MFPKLESSDLCLFAPICKSNEINKTLAPPQSHFTTFSLLNSSLWNENRFANTNDTTEWNIYEKKRKKTQIQTFEAQFFHVQKQFYAYE